MLYQRIKSRQERLHLYGGNVFTYAASKAALTYGTEWLDVLLPYLKQTLTTLEKHLKNTEISYQRPQATYQIWMDFSAYSMSDDELKQKFLDLFTIM